MDFPIFEAIMLICFGAAWPFSIRKSWMARTTKGKSLFFLMVLDVGYISGILHKVFWSMDKVLLLYILNFVLVSIDIAIYFRNRKIETR